MRSETEMLTLILDVARRDDRVRAVMMNGSRTNPLAPKDPFQDYDIVYIVRDYDSFLNDPGWIDIFGGRLLMQLPEAMELLPPQGDGHFTYLMLFDDGNRLDLSLYPLGKWREIVDLEDSLTTVLLDKDAILPALPPADDRGYHTAPPTAKLYADCCNEFWWVIFTMCGLFQELALTVGEHFGFIYPAAEARKMTAYLRHVQGLPRDAAEIY